MESPYPLESDLPNTGIVNESRTVMKDLEDPGPNW